MPELRGSGESGSVRFRRLGFGVAATVLLVDQLTKLLVVRFLGAEPVHIVGGIHLQFFRNFAGPGGNFAGHTVLISIFTVIAAIALIVVMARTRLDRLNAIALGLFLGGALGNGLDRILRGPSPLHGGVVDWLSLSTNGASMNLADLSLNAAVLVLVAGAILSIRPSKGNRAARGAPSH
ncbi:MAG TPA: signal peptidase II [Solirubrobacterales bacterium]|nr:signal peptidase II [Solirubrobacterales bacterium]